LRQPGADLQRDGFRQRRIEPEQRQQPLERSDLLHIDGEQAGCRRGDQIAQVEFGLRIFNRSRQISGCALLRPHFANLSQKVRQPRFSDRHTPHAAKVGDVWRGIGFGTQDQPGPVERAARNPLRLREQPLVLDTANLHLLAPQQT
jgi:hypothetical protein